MSVSNYTAKIKSIYNSLGSININVDEDEMVQVCLGGLAQWFNLLMKAILARETPPSFFDLQSMLLVRKNHVWTKTKTSEGQMFFSNSDGGRGRGRDGRRGRDNRSHEWNTNLRQQDESHRGTFGRMGSFHAEQGRKTRTIAEKLATTRSAKKEEASRLPQVNNSQITPPTPNTRLWWPIHNET